MSSYPERMMTKNGKLARIAEIDKMFEEATGWGSWMAEASRERYGLVQRLKQYDGVTLEHKYELKVGTP